MRNWNKIIIKIFAWIFFINFTTGIYSTIYLDYLKRPWLIGADYMPADLNHPEMTEIYFSLFQCFLFSISTLLILINYRKALTIFAFVLIQNPILSLLLTLNTYHYNYVLNNSLISIIATFAINSIPLYLIFREQRNAHKKAKLAF